VVLDLGKQLEHCLPDQVTVRDHVAKIGPSVRDFGMRVALRWVVDVGIDSALEDLVEVRLERRPSEDPPAEMVPGECREVPDVEDEGMTQRDGTGQYRVGCHKPE